MAQATTRNLNESRAEALSAILQSLSPDTTQTATNGNGDKPFSEQVRTLSDKLGQILGDQAEAGEPSQRNEKGELINEEGLPIVDISEPVTSADITFRPDPDGHFDDPDLLPLWALSPTEQARRRAERERILDLLEEEERIQERRDAEAARVQLQQEMEKRKETARVEVENLKRARELQKKMGRALIRSVVESRDKEEKEQAELSEKDKLVATNKAPKAKKSVSFADDIDENGRIKPSEKEKGLDWGDVAPGTLRPSSSKPLAERQDRQPMKLHVVERHPRGLGQSQVQPPEKDSDDESDPGAAEDDSDDGFLGDNKPADSEDSDEEAPGDVQISDWNDDDLDYAQHQREVALEYYSKRQAIGADAGSAFRAHSHDGDEWDQPEVPLEATLAAGPPRSGVSRFKAEHTARGEPTNGTLASHSLGASVVSSSGASTMKRAIRLGKLENGELVGGEAGESEDEGFADDENARQMLELLKKGEVTNIGPPPVSTIVTPPTPTATVVSTVASTVPSTSERPSAESISQPQASKPSKISKFKLSLAQSEPLQSSAPGTPASGTNTPTDLANRSSPKMISPRGGTPVQGNTPSSSAAPQPPKFTLPPEIQAAFQNGDLPAGMPGMIVESPSFLPPRGQVASPPLSTVSPTSTIVATPTSAISGDSPTGDGAAKPASPATTMRETVLERRPPVVVSSGASSRSQASSEGPKPRVSRFKAQRS